MKFNNLKHLFSLSTIVLLLVGCKPELDIEEEVSPSTYPNITISAVTPSGSTVNEGDSPVFEFEISMDKMRDFQTFISARQVGGDADSEDYAFSSSVIEPYETETSFSFSIAADGITEETETLQLEIGAFDHHSMYEVNLTPVIYEVTIENCATCVTCDWTLDMQDSYGDGWNGGYLTFIADGNALGDYAASGYGSSETIAIPDSALLEVFYTAGSWESENTYQIYDPNGTLVFEDGTYPSEGLVYSTTNMCP